MLTYTGPLRHRRPVATHNGPRIREGDRQAGGYPHLPTAQMGETDTRLPQPATPVAQAGQFR